MATALKLDSLPCQHGAFETVEQDGGGALDDHVTERGYCHDCRAWWSITVYRSSDRTDERALTTAEISTLKLLRNARKDRV